MTRRGRRRGGGVNTSGREGGHIKNEVEPHALKAWGQS